MNNKTPLGALKNEAPIISRLSKVKRNGKNGYIALCPCHDDKTPSLAVTIKPDGVTLIHCFGCNANGLDVCNALGIEPSVLFPPTDKPRYEKQTRQGFDAWQLMHALKDDLIRLLVVANGMKTIDALSSEDRDFVSSLVIRINDGISYLEGAHQ